MAAYELRPVYDSRQSFYGKARVEENNGDLELISYSTRVAVIYADGTARVYGTYSATTLRHIKDFLKQHGFRADSASQIMKDYGGEQPEPAEKEDNSLKTVAAVAALGNIFSNNQAEANDWKTRMLKAGLGEGLHLPDDWDSLADDEKAKRLDEAIKTLGE